MFSPSENSLIELSIVLWKEAELFSYQVIVSAFFATLRQIYVNAFVAVPLDQKKKKLELNVSGPVFIWLCILQLQMLKAK